nr:hypothetical protein [Tanacetum cinerariifolium]
MHKKESKVDTGKALNANLVVTESSGTESEVQDKSSSSGNDTDMDDADIRPIYDEEPMDKEKVFVIAALKNDLRKLKGNNVDTKFAKTSVLGNSILQSLRNQSVVRQPNAFKSKRPQMWIPRGKLFTSCTSKDDSESTHGSNVDISNIHECKQTLDVSAESGSLFSPLFNEYFNGENQVVSKSSAVATADASDKRQQQPDSTSSTSTLATTVTADGNFEL